MKCWVCGWFSVYVCTRERMWRGGHFDSPDEVVHGNLDLVLHVLHTGPQRMQVERAIPVRD